MAKSYTEINEKIKNGKAVVLTAEEVSELSKSLSPKEIAAKVDIVTTGTFGAMAFYGYTTKKDLTSLGKILFMALIGLIIATVVNMFLKSSGFEYILSYAGVAIFVGLTAWDSQKIKMMLQTQYDMSEGAQKLALIGALTLYLDFINLFLYLLRIFGSNKE